MVLPRNINTLEVSKFLEDYDGDVAVRVITSGAVPTGWDVINVTYPTTSTENYEFVANSITLKNILLTYTDDSKEVLTKVEVV